MAFEHTKKDKSWLASFTSLGTLELLPPTASTILDHEVLLLGYGNFNSGLPYEDSRGRVLRENYDTKEIFLDFTDEKWLIRERARETDAKRPKHVPASSGPWADVAAIKWI
jgi:hypothetical protein